MVHVDSAAPHFLPAFWEFSNKVFPEQRRGKCGPTAWPAPYSDLTFLQFCLWRHIKSTFYATEVIDAQDMQRWT
jgi:hypothetical protein